VACLDHRQLPDRLLRAVFAARARARAQLHPRRVPQLQPEQRGVGRTLLPSDRLRHRADCGRACVRAARLQEVLVLGLQASALPRADVHLEAELQAQRRPMTITETLLFLFFYVMLKLNLKIHLAMLAFCLFSLCFFF
jgi:hypothetical protein